MRSSINKKRCMVESKSENKMIILARIGRIIWINQIIKRTINTITNNI